MFIKNNLRLFTIFLLLIINIVIAWSLIKNSIYIKTINSKYKNLNISNKSLKDTNNELIGAFLSNGRSIKDVIVINKKNERIRLRKFICNNQKTIVFRIYDKNCQACIQLHLASLKTLSKKNYLKNVIIITDYSQEKLKWLDIKYSNCFKVFSIKNKLKLDIEKNNTPYFFLLDSSMIIKKVFPLTGNLINNTDLFFSEIKNY